MYDENHRSLNITLFSFSVRILIIEEWVWDDGRLIVKNNSLIKNRVGVASLDSAK